MALLPFGRAAMIKTVNSKNKDASRTEYGIALGSSLLTPGALRVYIPHRNLIAVRNIRNIRDGRTFRFIFVGYMEPRFLQRTRLQGRRGHHISTQYEHHCSSQEGPVNVGTIST